MKKIIAVLMVLLLLTGCTPVKPIEPATEPITESISGGTSASGLTVHFLDVQHADCILLACGGEYALVDGGYPESGDRIVEYLQEQGVKELDLMVGTHPHGDHIGGLPTVLNTFPTDTVWTSQLPYTNDYVSSFTRAVNRNGADFVQPRPGERFLLGDATIDVIGPLNLQYDDANDLSLVLMLSLIHI